MSLMLYTDKHWEAFLRKVGRNDLVADSRFTSLAGRTANIDEIYQFVSEQLLERSTADWMEILDEIDVPHAPVQSLADVLEDPHLVAGGALAKVNHPTAGLINTVRSPFLFDGLRTADLSPARSLGQDTEIFTAAHSAQVQFAEPIQEERVGLEVSAPVTSIKLEYSERLQR